MAHFGSISKGRSLKNVVRALHELICERPDLKEVIAFEVYGANIDPVSEKALLDWPLGKVFTCHGRLDYDTETGKSGRQQVMEKMKQSDLLILLHGDRGALKEYIPSKLYEYMLTLRPILGCTSDEFELGRYLLENGYYVAQGDSYTSIKKGIMHYLRQWEISGLPDLEIKTDVTVSNAVETLIEITQKIDTAMSTNTVK